MKPITEEHARAALSHLGKRCGDLQSLLHSLGEKGRDSSADIHLIRKTGKVIRGGIALFRLERTAARSVRSIGRMLADRRDAVSLQHTWSRLEWHEEPKTAAAVTALLAAAAASAAAPPREAVDWCIDRIAETSAVVSALNPESAAIKATKGWHQLRRNAHKACADLDYRNEEAFHHARKTLKAWTGAAGLFPDDSQKLPEPAESLAECLGDENDLATLASWLRRHGFTRHISPGLCSVVQVARRKCQRAAIRQATALTKIRH